MPGDPVVSRPQYPLGDRLEDVGEPNLDAPSPPNIPRAMKASIGMNGMQYLARQLVYCMRLCVQGV